MPTTKKPPGKGLVEKRGRILRSLDAHVRWLTVVETMGPFAPPVRQERPPRPADPHPYRADMRGRKWTPRERPELHPAPGAEALSEEEVKAWVELNPFVHGGLSPKTQRAMAFIYQFRPRHAPGAQVQ